MKYITFHKESTGYLKVDLNEAFELLFGKNTVTEVHGPSLTITDWSPNKAKRIARTLKFIMDTNELPPEVKGLVSEKKVVAKIKQEILLRTDHKITIKGKFRIDVFGLSKMLKINNVMTIEKENINNVDVVSVSGKIEYNAFLLPYLNDIAENYMAIKIHNELSLYQTIIFRKLQERTETKE